MPPPEPKASISARMKRWMSPRAPRPDDGEDAPPPSLTSIRVDLLKGCPDLRGIGDAEEEWQRLAALFQPKQYRHGASNVMGAGPPDTPQRGGAAVAGSRGAAGTSEAPGALSPRALRVVVSGHLLVHFGPHGLRKRVYGPPALTGTSAVVAALGAPGEADVTAAERMLERVHVSAAGTTWVLELGPEQFAAAFPPGSRAREAVRRAFRVSLLGPRAVDALAADADLGNLSTDHLYALLEGAELRDVPPGGLVAEEGPTDAGFFVVLEGTLEHRLAGGRIAVQEAPATVRVSHFLSGSRAEGAVYVRGADHVLWVDGRTFRLLYRIDPSFRTAMASRSGARTEDRGATEPGVDRHLARTVLVITARAFARARPDVVGVLGGLTDLLGEAIAGSLYDRVVVLHLLPAGAPLPPSTVQGYGDGALAGPDACWLEDRWAHVPDDAGGVAPLVHEARRVGDDGRAAPDVVLVDTAALDDAGGALVEQGFASVPAPVKLLYLTHDSDVLPPNSILLASCPVVDTAVLPAQDPFEGMGAAAVHVREARDVLETALRDASAAFRGGASPAQVRAVTRDVRGVGGRLRALGEALRQSSAAAARRVGQMGRKSLSALRRGDAPVHGVWPMGAVRVRFRAALLHALENRAQPSRLADLGLSPAEASAARRTLERWARAVTRRRVGLTLGGGGPYGAVHIPLVEELEDQGIPIDFITGASVGSTIGAYYAVLGRPGLALFLSRSNLIILASLFGFVSSAVLEAVLTLDFWLAELPESEVPFFPVATDADVGRETDLRGGRVALGVRASGSLPPLIGPTVIGDRRFLDGGLTANVPVDVLRNEGSALTVVSNPIASVKARPRLDAPAIPFLGHLLREGNPWLRLEDTVRLVPIVFQTAGGTQVGGPDVILYRPAAADIGGLPSFSEKSLTQTRSSIGLQQAVAEARARYRRLLGHPPACVRLDAPAMRVQVDGWIGFDEGTAALHASSAELLSDLAVFLTDRPDGLRVSCLGIQVFAADLDLARRRALAVIEALARRGVPRERLQAMGDPERVPQTPPIAPGTPVSSREGDPTLAVERVELRVLGSLRADDEGLHREIDELRRRDARAAAEARRAEARRLAAALATAARWEIRFADTELGRLLALEAAWIAPDAQADALLRLLLRRRGRALDPRDPSCAPALAALAAAGLASDPWARSPDGKLVAAATGEGRLRLVREGTSPLLDLDLGDPVRSIAWHPGGARIAVATGHGAVIFETSDLLAGKQAPAVTLPGHDRAVSRVAWSPDGERLATVSDDGSARIWDARTGAFGMQMRPAGSMPVAVAWHPTADRLATGADTGEVVVWNASTGQLYARLEGGRSPITALAFAAGGARVAAACEDGTTLAWDPDVCARVEYDGHDGAALVTAAWHPTAVQVLTAAEDGAMDVWDPTTGQRVQRLLPPGGAVAAAAWVAGGTRIAAARAGDPRVSLWSAGDLSPVSPALAPESADHLLDGVPRLYPSPDGRYLALARDEGLSFWDLGTGERIAHLDGLTRAFAWDPAIPGRFARATVGPVHLLTIGPQGSTSALVLAETDAGVAALAFSADGSRVLSGCDDACARVHDARSGAVLARLRHPGPVRTVAFSPGEPAGRTLATAHALRAVVWGEDPAGTRGETQDGLADELGTFAPLGDPSRPLGTVTRLVFSSDGRCLAVVAGDVQLMRASPPDPGPAVWSVAAVLEGHPGGARAASFGPGDAAVVTAGADGSAVIHPATFDALVERAGAMPGRNALTQAEWTRFLGPDLAYRATWPPPGE